jgi:hypothetical protein
MKLQISKTKKSKSFHSTKLQWQEDSTDKWSSGATVYEHSERILINCQFWFQKKKTWLVPCQQSIVQLTSEFENMCTSNPRILTPSTAGNTFALILHSRPCIRTLKSSSRTIYLSLKFELPWSSSLGHFTLRYQHPNNELIPNPEDDSFFCDEKMTLLTIGHSGHRKEP